MLFVNFVLVFDKIIFVPRSKPTYLCPQVKHLKLYAMRHKFSYLVGAVFLLCCSTSMFTSCLEIDDTIDTAASGGGTEDNHLPKLGGAYFEDEDGDNELYMTYNGKVLKGRKVTFTPDEKNETAIITFSGAEVDLSSMLSGLMSFRITPYSPIPGVRKLTLTDIKLTPMEDGRTYSFEGAYDQVDDDPETYDDYRMSFKGTVKEGEMHVDIQCKILGEDLLGTWGLNDVVTGGSAVTALAGSLIGGGAAFRESNTCSSLWIDWSTPKEIDLGKLNEVVPPSMLEKLGGLVSAAGGLVNVKGTPNKLIGIMFTDDIASAIGANPENIIANMLKDVTGDRNGSMYFSYSYTGDIFNKPSDDQWGGGKEDALSNNIIRYHFDKKIKNRVYLEINPDFLLSAVGGLMTTSVTSAAANTLTLSNKATTRAHSKDETLAIGQRLIDKLKPALEQGIPCDYAIGNDGKIQINIEGVYLRDVLRILAELGNDPLAYDEIVKFLKGNPSLSEFAPTIIKLIQQLPGVLDKDCKYVKLGFKLHKTAELAPEEPVEPETPENPEPEVPTPDTPESEG